MNAAGRSVRAPLVALLALAELLLSAAAAGPPAPLAIDTADGPRQAYVVAHGQGPRPTAIVLHGASTTAADTMGYPGFVQAAEKVGFNLAFPDGLDKRWNDGRGDDPHGPDDVAFLRALADRLVADGVGERGRIFIAGISNGGIMALTMACAARGAFAGFGTIVASMPAPLRACRPQAGPLIMIAGTADPLVPYGGGPIAGGTRGAVVGVEETAAMFATSDGCGPRTEVPLVPKHAGAPTRVTQIDWAGCRAGTSVTVLRVEGGGHEVPGAPAFGRELLGESNQDISSAMSVMLVFAASVATAPR